MNSEQFVAVLIEVLSKEVVIHKFQEIISSPLEFDIKILQESNKKILSEITEVKNNNNQLKKELEQWKLKVEEKDVQITELKSKIDELENKFDEQEQYSRRNSLRIQGLTEKPNENLVERLKYVAKKRMNVEMDDLDIDRIHRVGQPKTGKSRDVIVKFTTYRARHLIFKARTGLRKPADDDNDDDDEMDPEIEIGTQKSDSPYKSDLTAQRIFINEDLTRYRSNLLWKARQCKKNNGIIDCWSYDGRILIKNNNNKITSVQNEQELKSCM